MRNWEKILLLMVVMAVFILINKPISVAAADDDDDDDGIYDEFDVVGFVDSAFYADLDGFGDIYDVEANISVSIINFKEDDFEDGYSLVLNAGLELPSGQIFWYTIDYTAYEPEFRLKLWFLNHCLETGWYKAYLYSFEEDEEEDQFYSFLDFDPPGGEKGGLPQFGYSSI